VGALGSAFPAEYLKQQVTRQLVPGCVIKLCEEMDDGRIQEKRYVVLSLGVHTTCCVINSKIGPFLQARPELLKCQVLMKVEHHGFMDHDSHVDCSRTKKFHTDHVIKELVAKLDWMLGTVAVDLREEIVAGLKHSPVLSAADVDELSKSLVGVTNF
jgi:hypothetical protein